MTRKAAQGKTSKAKGAAYWVWESNSTDRGMAFATDIAGLDDEAQRRVLIGEPLDPVPKVVVTATTPGRFRDELGTFAGILFVSPKLRQALEETPGARIQFIPTQVRGKPDLRYFAVNVLDTVPAMDPERSKVTRYPGTDLIRRIERFVPRAIPRDAPPVFHVAEAPSIVLVREDLRARLAAAGDHPGRFTPLEKYRVGA